MKQRLQKDVPVKILTIGGGKGQSTILQGLKERVEFIRLSAIVSMVDNGGSTGRLSEELGIPPFGGDFRDVLVALSNNKQVADLFHHRYEHGEEIRGHSVGNLILLGLLEQSEWNIPKAIDIAKEILNINAEIYPSTLDIISLVAKYDDGTVIQGQDEIDNNLEKKYHTIEEIYTEPEGQAYTEAIKAIKSADLIVLCPGDLYGSLLCNVVIPGIKDAIKDSSAEIIYITNLMTKINQTHGWKTSQFIDEVAKYLPRKIDYAVVNTGTLPKETNEKYLSEKWEMVENDIDEDEYKGTKLLKGEVWYEGKEFKRVSSDVIPRSFIRHDPDKIAEKIMSVVNE